MKTYFLYTISVLALLLCFSSNIYSQKFNANHKVFLLGNLDQLDIASDYFKAFSSEIKSLNVEYTVLINGDFVGNAGFSFPEESEELARIEALTSLSSKNGRVIFIPGDKEWDDSGEDGKKKMSALEKYLDKNTGKNVKLYPRNSCLGPDIIELNDNLELLTINTQWFLQGKRVEEEDGTCKFLNERELWGELSDLLAERNDKNLIVALHHPLVSYGQYAGYKLGSMHLFPPIYGTFKASFQKNIGGPKDLQNEKLVAFRNRFNDIAKDVQGVIFTSGHEYDLQINKRDENYHINSGSFVESRPVAKSDETLFSENAKGYVELDFKSDGEIIATVMKKNAEIFEEALSQVLFNSPCNINTKNTIPFNPSYSPCKQSNYLTGEINIPKMGTAIASTDYKKGPGKMYRSTWELPIKDVPYLDIGTYAGGLTLYKAGGAGETSSLKFKTKDGRKIAFRSLDKSPETRLSEELENSTMGRVTKDLVAHQHPYGSLVAKDFAEKLDLSHTDPILYMVPDDPRLGEYQNRFAGMLGTLETKPYGEKDGQPGYKGARKIVSTYKMYRDLLDNKKAKFDTESYINSRLLDMWLADWDRHDDNWAWLLYEKDDEILYKAFPKDKDKVFAIFDGIYKAINWEFVPLFWASFREDDYGLRSLNYRSKDKDRWFLSSLTREDWQNQVDFFLSQMDDTTIDKALTNMPPEAQALTSADMKRTLLIRKDMMPDAIDKYYDMLAKSIYVVGTNNRELFDLVRQPNGDVQVTVYRISKSGNKKEVIYSRLVKENETKEIILFGLGKKDVFEISGNANKKLAIRIVGGAGKDKINDSSSVSEGKSTFIYAKNKKDDMNLGETGKFLKTENDILFNTQNIFNYDYGLTLPSVGFNAEDGINLGVIYFNTKQEFAKEEFGSKTNLTANITSNLNASINYNYVKRRIGTLWDVNFSIYGNSKDRSHQFFYGFGNESILNEDLRRDNFYRNDTKLLGTKIGLIKKFWTKSHFNPSLRIEYKDVTESPQVEEGNSIFNEIIGINGLGSNTLIGGDMELLIDFTDSKNLPRDGTRLQINNYTFYNTEEDLDLGGRIDLETSIYMSVGAKQRLTLGLRGGYSKTYGDLPFYQLSSIGQRSNNRGFRRNRFIGESAAYYNTELRWHVGNINNPIIPLRFGVFGLYDAGRVWVDNESSNTWHSSYGGGLYIVPYTEAFSLHMTFAKNDNNGSLLSFGIGALL